MPAFTGNKQTATYHITEFVQDRCAIEKMPEDKLVTSETEFSGAVEGRAPKRDGSTPTWKTCAHCERARTKANAPAPEAAPEAPKAEKVKRESKKAREAREAAEAAAAAEASAEVGAPDDIIQPVDESEAPPAPIDLFAEEPTA